MLVEVGFTSIPGRLWATEETNNHLHLDCVLTHNTDVWPRASGRETQRTQEIEVAFREALSVYVHIYSQWRWSGVNSNVYFSPLSTFPQVFPPISDEGLDDSGR